MSKKARTSTPADDEKQALWQEHGRPMCDSMAGSLEKKGGYKHVTFNRRRGCYIAQVYDIEACKLVYLGGFITPYAAAVTVALSKTMDLQDKRDSRSAAQWRARVIQRYDLERKRKRATTPTTDVAGVAGNTRYLRHGTIRDEHIV